MQCLLLGNWLHVMVGYCYAVNALMPVHKPPSPVLARCLSRDVCMRLPRFVVDVLLVYCCCWQQTTQTASAVLNSIMCNNVILDLNLDLANTSSMSSYYLIDS